jgi:hypothetical protein
LSTDASLWAFCRSFSSWPFWSAIWTAAPTVGETVDAAPFTATSSSWIDGGAAAAAAEADLGSLEVGRLGRLDDRVGWSAEESRRTVPRPTGVLRPGEMEARVEREEHDDDDAGAALPRGVREDFERVDILERI